MTAATITTANDVPPTADEMDAMWLAQRRAEQDAADRASYERCRRMAHAPILEKALADEALYGAAP